MINYDVNEHTLVGWVGSILKQGRYARVWGLWVESRLKSPADPCIGLGSGVDWIYWLDGWATAVFVTILPGNIVMFPALECDVMEGKVEWEVLKVAPITGTAISTGLCEL